MILLGLFFDSTAQHLYYDRHPVPFRRLAPLDQPEMRVAGNSPLGR
jgi:hypothetical protein